MQFKLPELGEGVHEGELVKWKVKVGDLVKDDQPLCEIMTDKATMEIPSAFTGKVAELNAKEGDIVHVGQLMCSFEGAAGAGKAAGATAAAPSPGKGPAAQAPAPMAAAASQQRQAAAAGMTGAAGGSLQMGNLDIASRPLAAPITRRLAREAGVDLSRVQPSGPHGRVMKEDVERMIGGASAPSHSVGGGAGAFAPGRSASGTGATVAGRPLAAYSPGPAQTGALEERVPFRGLRKKIAEKMRLSKDHAAHFTYVEECDATALVEIRTQAKEIAAKQGIKLTYLPFIMKTMVAAARRYPVLNSQLDEEKQELIYKNYFNISLSVQTEDGLMAPVIHDVHKKSILQIAKDIQDVVERARTKKLTLDDLHGGTVTLTNAGTIGGLFATPIINYPEVAILGFNKIARKPVVKVIGGKEEIVIRDWTLFSLSLDHRIVDGAIGAEYLKLFIQYIENPALLLLEGL
jgi:pyruvate dehydrogenase E2 component (dihydrolipoamide acetyltransferase)